MIKTNICKSVCENIRQLIENYIDCLRTRYYNEFSIEKPIFTNINDLKKALELFINNEHQAINTYSHVIFWDVSCITDMSFLFRKKICVISI